MTDPKDIDALRELIASISYVGGEPEIATYEEAYRNDEEGDDDDD